MMIKKNLNTLHHRSEVRVHSSPTNRPVADKENKKSLGHKILNIRIIKKIYLAHGILNIKIGHIYI